MAVSKIIIMQQKIQYCGTGYLFHKMPHFLGEWGIICLWERE